MHKALLKILNNIILLNIINPIISLNNMLIDYPGSKHREEAYFSDFKIFI